MPNLNSGRSSAARFPGPRPKRSADAPRHQPADLGAGRRGKVRRGRAAVTPESRRTASRHWAGTTRSRSTRNTSSAPCSSIFGKFDEAEQGSCANALTAQRRVLGAQHQDTLHRSTSSGSCCKTAASSTRPIRLAIEYEHGIRCMFGTKHPDNVTALVNRGRSPPQPGPPR